MGMHTLPCRQSNMPTWCPKSHKNCEAYWTQHAGVCKHLLPTKLRRLQLDTAWQVCGHTCCPQSCSR